MKLPPRDSSVAQLSEYLAAAVRNLWTKEAVWRKQDRDL